MAYRSKKWIVSVLISSTITLLSVGGVAYSIYYSYNKYALGSEFAKSYNYRIELEDNKLGFDNVKLQQTADAFAQYLKYCDIETYKNVYFEHVGSKAYLNFTLPIKKEFPINIINSEYDSSATNKPKWEVPATTELYNTINSNNIDFIFDCNTAIKAEQGESDKIPTNNSGKAFVTSFTSNDLIDSPSAISVDKNRQIIIDLKNESTDKITSKNFLNIYEHLVSPVDNPAPEDDKDKKTDDTNKGGDTTKKAILTADPEPSPTPPSPSPSPEPPKPTPVSNASKPEIYIIRDKNTLITRMHYILNCYATYFLFHSNDDHSWIEKDNKLCSYFYGYTFLSADEKQWADTVFKDAFLPINRTVNGIPNFRFWLNGNLLQTATHTTLYPYAKWTDLFKAIDDNEKFYIDPIATVPTNYSSMINTSNIAGQPWQTSDFADTFFYRLIDFGKNNLFKENTGIFNGELKIPPALVHKDNAYLWDWMKPYVVGIINQTNFDKYFPEKDPHDSTAKADKKNIGKWFVLGNNGASDLIHSSKSEVDLLYHSLTPYSSSSSSYKMNYEFKIVTEPTAENDNESVWAKAIAYTEVDPNGKEVAKPVTYLEKYGMLSSYNNNHSFLINDKKLNNGIFIQDPFISTIVGILAIVLIIGIIVSILYRVPGVLYILNLLSISSLSILLFILTGKTIGLGLLLGLICGILLVTLCFILFMQRTKKHTMKKDFLSNSFKKGFKNSIWQVIDILVVSIICGLCFLFFSGKIIADFGLSLLLFSAIAVAGIAIWYLSIFLMFGNWKLEQRTGLAFYKKTLPNSISIDEEQQTTFIRFKKLTKFNFFGKWKEIISGICIAVIILVGLILAFTLGLKNSYEIFGGTRILILSHSDPQSLYDQLKNIPDLGFYNIQKQTDYWVLFTKTDLYGNDTLLSSVQAILGTNGFVQKVEPLEMFSAIQNALMGILILSLFATLYSLIRINWTVAVPVFVTIWVQTLLLLSICVIFQIQLNEETIQFLPLFVSINTMVTTVFVGNLTNRWIKQKYFDYSTLKTVLNEEIKSSIFNYFLYVFGVVAIISFSLILFSSTTFIIPLIILLLNSIISLIVLVTVTKSLIPIFACLRYKFLIKVSQNNIFVKNNYDKIDEQSIEGINKHKFIKISL